MLRERSSIVVSTQSNSESISTITRQMGDAVLATHDSWRAPAIAAVAVESASNSGSGSGPTAQKIRKLRDPRDSQQVFRALVKHVVLVEPSTDPAFAQNVTSITVCTPIVCHLENIESFLVKACHYLLVEKFSNEVFRAV